MKIKRSFEMDIHVVPLNTNKKKLNSEFFLLVYYNEPGVAHCTYKVRGVEIVKFSTCPGASKKPKCTCP